MKFSNKKIWNIFYSNALLTGFLALTVSSCASYTSQFICPDAKGANCTSMGRVYEMIESGEIEVYNEQSKKCGGKHCKRYKELKSPQKKIPLDTKVYYKSNT